jgi:hypothetical protein
VVLTRAVLAFSVEPRREGRAPNSPSILRHELCLADVPIRAAADFERAPGSRRSRQTHATNATGSTLTPRYAGTVIGELANATRGHGDAGNATQTRRNEGTPRREERSTSRSEIRCNISFRAARLVIWNTRASVLFGVAPHADATSRNSTPRDAPTPRNATTPPHEPTLRSPGPRRGPLAETNAEALVPRGSAVPRRNSRGTGRDNRGLRTRSCTRHSVTPLTRSPCVPRTRSN